MDGLVPTLAITAVMTQFDEDESRSTDLPSRSFLLHLFAADFDFFYVSANLARIDWKKRQGNVTERGTESVALPVALLDVFTRFLLHENKRSAKLYIVKGQKQVMSHDPLKKLDS